MQTVAWTGLVLALAPLAGCAGGRQGTLAGSTALGEDVARRAGLDAPAGVPGPDAERGVRALLAEPLAEAAAVKVALLQNASVRATYERLGIARADLLQAGLLRNPVFALDVASFSGGPEVELAFTQSFVELFFRPLRRQVAAAELRAEQAAVVRDLVRLVYDVRRAFASVQAADAVLAIEEDVLRRAEASRDLMRQLHAAGNALDTVRTLEEAAATRARLDVEAARLRAGEAREVLGVLLGEPGEAARLAIAQDASLPAPAAVPVDPVERAVAASLDLQESDARIAAAACRAGLVRRSGAWPELDLGAAGRRDRGSDGSWGLGPALALALPIFDHGQARALAAHADLRRRWAEREQRVVEVRSAARRLARRRASLEQRLATLRDVYLPLRAQLVEEVLQHFNAMQIGAFDVLRAKQQELDARREHAETLREARLASLDLSELLAGCLHPERLRTLDLPEAAEAPEAPKGH